MFEYTPDDYSPEEKAYDESQPEVELDDEKLF